MKGLICNIYRSDFDSPIAKMRGKKSVTLVNFTPPRLRHSELKVEQTVPEIFEADDDAPAVRIIRRFIGGRDYYHVEPVEPGFYAFDGTYIKTSDSRFPFDYPLPLHDRQMDLESNPSQD